MEEEKSKKGLIGVLIVVIVLLLCAVAYLLFVNKTTNNKIDNNSVNIKKCTNYEYEKNYIQHFNKKTKIFATYSHSILFSSDNELYLASTRDGNILISNAIFMIEDLTFKNNLATIYTAENGVFASSDSNHSEIKNKEQLIINILKLNIKADDVYKAIMLNDEGTTDQTADLFILYRTGGFTHYSIPTGWDTSKSSVLYHEFQIVDIEPIIKKYTDTGEVDGVFYRLLLKDGTTKDIDNLYEQ